MQNNPEFLDRLEHLSRRASRLRNLARQKVMNADDGPLWMSSLDIMGELLSVVQRMVDEQHQAQLNAQFAGFGYDGDDEDAGDILMQCPNCHDIVSIAFGAVEEAAAICPHCGSTVLLTNPT